MPILCSMEESDLDEERSHEFLIKQLPIKVDQLNRLVSEIQAHGWNDKNAPLVAHAGEVLNNMAKELGIKAIEDLIQTLNELIAKKENLDQIKVLVNDVTEALHSSPLLEQSVLVNEPLKIRPTLLLGLGDKKLAIEQVKYFNYHCIAFPSLDEIIKFIQTKRKVDAIILDMEYCQNTQPQEIKSQLGNIPIIFISKENEMATRIFAVQSGGVAFLTKPVEFTTLIEKIDQVVTPDHEASPYRVLIVEDSLTQATHIKNELNHAGMNVEILENPLMLNQMLNDFQPDLILIDLYMPKCSGIELAKVIRQQDFFVSIPIVFISIETDPNKQFDAIFLGGDDFLTKPLNSTYLIEMIIARAKRYRTIHQEMIQDSLTGVLNHTRLLEQLEMEIARAQRSKTALSFAMLDLDNFKIINDTHGHPIGDKVIKSLAKLLQQQMRKSDSIGRYGGEEFALIFPLSDQDAVYKKLDEIRRSFSRLLHLDNDPSIEFTTTFSAGIAQLGDQHNTVDKLVQAADKALYLAKKQGRNRIITSD